MFSLVYVLVSLSALKRYWTSPNLFFVPYDIFYFLIIYILLNYYGLIVRDCWIAMILYGLYNW